MEGIDATCPYGHLVKICLVVYIGLGTGKHGTKSSLISDEFLPTAGHIWL